MFNEDDNVSLFSILYKIIGKMVRGRRVLGIYWGFCEGFGDYVICGEFDGLFFFFLFRYLRRGVIFIFVKRGYRSRILRRIFGMV